MLANDASSLEDARDRMVAMQIARRGVRDPAVLAAMRKVPHERLVAPHLAAHACEDRPLPIGEGRRSRSRTSSRS
jgi:protein-L-isoaspartate(D-aspartate) O-methyltransferase